MQKETKQKIFYKMRMVVDEDGIAISTRRYYSIHETPCFHFCVAEHDRVWINPPLQRDGETALKAAKRRGVKIYRIHKSGSRIAFETEDQASDHLQFLKRKQLSHMRRDMEFVQRFLEVTKGKSRSDMKRNRLDLMILPGTQELVGEYFMFD